MFQGLAIGLVNCFGLVLDCFCYDYTGSNWRGIELNSFKEIGLFSLKTILKMSSFFFIGLILLIPLYFVASFFDGYAGLIGIILFTFIICVWGALTVAFSFVTMDLIDKKFERFLN